MPRSTESARPGPRSAGPRLARPARPREVGNGARGDAVDLRRKTRLGLCIVWRPDHPRSLRPEGRTLGPRVRPSSPSVKLRADPRIIRRRPSFRATGRPARTEGHRQAPRRPGRPVPPRRTSLPATRGWAAPSLAAQRQTRTDRAVDEHRGRHHRGEPDDEATSRAWKLSRILTRRGTSAQSRNTASDTRKRQPPRARPEVTISCPAR